ncbi:RidA family protein [Pseudooceanicola atlanticus]|uniref:Endoribonuclease L-PSP n=1 Tax=Pseudooceanicola atlanticus TaxID=1461694 RepID=A0A0A0EH37_9RHOB|nr:RidA family protein [Pseudooceanicola atlanticus]KGM49383.1 endoribonuclease L-PSP [Pseudooceanicola atlanticus]
MLRSLIPADIAPPFARYAHGVAASEMGGIMVTSGQLALADDGTVPDGAEAQAALIFANLDAILREGGTDREHILRINAFVTGREHMAGYMAARDAWLADVAHLPASTLMIVSGFTRPEFVVEIEVMAALPA